MDAERAWAGDEIAEGRGVIEVRVSELRQLFHAIDPSPFRERDLDPGAAEFIEGWSRDLPAGTPLALLVHLGRAAGQADEATVLRQAVHEYYGRRAAASRRELRELFRRGRTALAIGLAFLGLSIGVGDAIAEYFADHHIAGILRESLLIGGWVAMWGPLEIFLYDWWPIRADARLFDRLASMPVRVLFESDVSSDAWRSDWPAVPVRKAPDGQRGRSPDTL